MKILIGILFLFFTTGCSSTAQRLEQALNEYAVQLSNQPASALLIQNLTGQAKVATEQSQQLLTQLGYIQSGVAKFQVIELIGPSQATACLDVTEVRLRDQTGRTVSMSGSPKRLQLKVDFRSIGQEILISDFRATGEKC